MDKDIRMTGRVTIPTDVDVVDDTLRLLDRWGADALRDCDGTLHGTDRSRYRTG